MPAIRLRPATPADLAFAFMVTESAMRGYVEQTWGTWEPEHQRRIHEQSFVAETHSIVLVDEAQAGVVAVQEHEGHVQLEKLYLLPGFRNRGIGAELLRRTLQRARAAAKPLRLRVLLVNTSAQRFYARHGFAVVETTGERVFMQA